MTSPPASPERIFETLNRYQHTMALKGAIDLDLFTYIAAGVRTAANLAQACDAPERSVGILCDFLTVLGFLRKDAGSYTLAPDAAAFLDRKSQTWMGSIAQFMARETALHQFRDVAALVKKGGALDGLGTVDGNPAIWIEFAQNMIPMIMPAALHVAALLAEPGLPQKVLDVAAGHGMFGIQFARRNPEAQVYALDLPAVLESAAVGNAARLGVGGRYHTIPGSAFEVELGSGYDLVLIPNFLHHFSFEENVSFLKRVRPALRPGGRVATLEFVPNADRVSPPIPASFSMMMLAYTPNGQAYTFPELEEMFRQAGFGSSTLQAVPPTPESLILTEY